MGARGPRTAVAGFLSYAEIVEPVEQDESRGEQPEPEAEGRGDEQPLHRAPSSTDR